MIKAGIIGATGYTGVELLRLLAPRNDVEIVAVSSRELAGKSVASHFPNLRGHVALDFVAPDSDLMSTCDVVFFATPHAVAMHSVPKIMDSGSRVIDLSADFRIKDIALWEQWYNTSHSCPQLVEKAVYGMPETNREKIAGEQLVASPGCYPTAIQLGLLPLLENNLVDTRRLIADAKSGVSGAGRKAVEDFLMCEASDSIKAYAVGGHRHHPEIKQQLLQYGGADVGLTFVPHLTPMIRGILATLYAPLQSENDANLENLQSLFQARYADEPFVDVLPLGELPATRNVKGSNYCQIAVSYSADTNSVVILSAIDNLVKGASGQAVQSMNIMFGLEETAGLTNIALLP